MIIFVKWLLAVLLTIPMLLLGLYLVREFNLRTNDLRAERVPVPPKKKRRKK